MTCLSSPHFYIMHILVPSSEICVRDQVAGMWVKELGRCCDPFTQALAKVPSRKVHGILHVTRYVHHDPKPWRQTTVYHKESSRDISLPIFFALQGPKLTMFLSLRAFYRNYFSNQLLNRQELCKIFRFVCEKKEYIVDQYTTQLQLRWYRVMGNRRCWTKLLIVELRRW